MWMTFSQSLALAAIVVWVGRAWRRRNRQERMSDQWMAGLEIGEETP